VTGWPEFEVVYGDGAFTEGPVWDGSRLIFTDIPSSRILAYDPQTNVTTTLFEDTQKANGLALGPEGLVYGCLDGGRVVARFEADGTRTVVADQFEGRKLNSPNDLAIDAEGRVWFSDPRYGPDRDDLELDHESVFLARPDGEGWRIERATFDTTRPNGVLLDPTRQILYVAQTHMPPPASCRELRAYPILDDHTLGEAEVVFDFGPHRGIDGMTLAPDGSVVAACGWTKSGPGPRIAVFGPDHQLKVEFPTADNPSNCCFGGPDGRDLYATGRDGALNRMAGLLEPDGSSPW
jgi:gluconolactonase